MEIGKYNELKVLRKSDLGYMLTDGQDEILMHFKQSLKEHEDGELLNVFIYTDDKRRPTGTEQEVLTTLDKPNFVKVVNKIEGSGIFVDINCPKDIFISKDYLPISEAKWPNVGDYLFVRLKIKKDVLTAKPLNRYEIEELTEVNYSEREIKEGYVARLTDKGIGIITKDIAYVFVPLNQLRGQYRLGEEVNVTISKKIENSYYGILNQHKEELMDIDRETILKYLDEHNGILRLTAKSSSEEIANIFPNMSRKAFKRAYGGIYKDRLIEFDEEKTWKLKK